MSEQERKKDNAVAWFIALLIPAMLIAAGAVAQSWEVPMWARYPLP